MSAELTVVDDPAGAASELLAEAAGKGGHVVITGGSTPRAAYERAAGLLDDWSAVELWFSDERCVPPDHEHSNYGMVKAALLDRIEGRAPGIHRMEGELGPHEGAERYEEEIAAAGFGESLPAFDLMILGTSGAMPGVSTPTTRRSRSPRAESPGNSEHTWASGPRPRTIRSNAGSDSPKPAAAISSS